MSKAKHGCGFQIVWRNADNTQQTWQAKCTCRKEWTGPEYEIVEDEWRKHVHELTGTIVSPAGNKVGRWSA